ncbi:MAG: transglycosylase domain-containing protein [Bacteroidales bacterium]|nr:transglycosylase domain-containing protein [Bacteroidales bacterium]
MSRKKKRILLATCIPGCIVMLLLIAFLLLPVFAKSYINRKIESWGKERNCTITIGQMEISHFSLSGKFTLKATDIHVKANDATEEFAVTDLLTAEIQAWHGFHLTKELHDLEAGTMDIHAVSSSSNGYNNYGFLHKNHKSSQTTGYNERVIRILETFNQLCPDKMSIQTINLTTDLDSISSRYQLSGMSIREGRMAGVLTALPGSPEASQWDIRGCIDKKKFRYSGEMSLTGSCSDSTAPLPLGPNPEENHLRFQRASFDFQVTEKQKDHTRMSISVGVRKLECFHRYLADIPVRIDSTGGHLDLCFHHESIVLDSTSSLQLNQAVIHPYLKISQNEKKQKHIVFSVNERKCDARSLFSSLPEGIFEVIPHIKVHGNMDLRVLLDCDFAQIDSLRFDFDLRSSDHTFGIDEGRELITRFNEPFTYVFYENGDTSRTVEISEVNPYFCPFDQIPEYLTKSILASEDASFFSHRGFIKSAIASALIADLQSGKLRRGGSTISQQLVKNLFLNRKKVFSRKFEEMLLVWLIEDYRIISKERMFEIYVNIAEWAPETIGIGEASQFYFEKKPQELTFAECLYLATLIRAPKHYRSTVDSDGNITENKRVELEFVVKRMVERGIITEEELQGFLPDVKIKLRQPGTPD